MPGSLRLRLMIFAATAISLALAIAGLVTYWAFQRHSSELALRQLDVHFSELLGQLEIDENGNPTVPVELSDPRFHQPYSGFYWQVDIAGKQSARSRSLWEEQLNVGTPPEEEEDEHVHELEGPNNTTLIGLERMIKLRQDDGTEPHAIVTVAINGKTVDAVQSKFRRELLWGLAALYLILLGSSFAQILLGLRPLGALKRDLEGIHAGKSNSLSGTYPTEVTPMIGELNGLLSAREKQLEKARQRASNLAHGFKTPLTVIKTLAQQLRRDGHDQISAEIDSNANIMRDLAERELTKARIAGDHVAHSTSLHVAVEKVISTLRRIAGRAVTFENNVPEDLVVPMDASDLLELLGNLLDNSRRYAKTMVRVTAETNHFTVEDDGPGVPPDKLNHIVKRGARLDEKSGTGIGLAIVSDLADSYGLTLQLSQSPLGGLRAEVGWPEPRKINP